jgi:predicted PurR-regulated permease PerM
VVPVVGPIIAAIPAFIFAVNQSLFLGLSTLALYVIIQQLENNLIVPVVMKRVVGLNKIIILMVLIIGGKLGGFAGIFLAVPLTLFIETILVEVLRVRKS